ncbi:MAG: hypothetical protein R3193_07150 [Marinobacter sp.]|nr:hypothetical protein [Marinobacter sp.]
MTLAELESLLAKYIKAEERALDGHSYEFGGRTWTSSDLRLIKAERERLERRINGMKQAAKGRRSHSLATFS